jgi:hypothetical protein
MFKLSFQRTILCPPAQAEVPSIADELDELICSFQ